MTAILDLCMGKPGLTGIPEEPSPGPCLFGKGTASVKGGMYY